MSILPCVVCPGTWRLTIHPVLYNPFPLPSYWQSCVHRLGPSLGVKSVKELVALAHAQPGKILFGSSGGGSATFMNAERFRMAAGIKAAHVGFKGQPEFLLAIDPDKLSGW